MKKLLTVVTLVSALSLSGNEANAWPWTDFCAKHPKIAAFLHLGPKHEVTAAAADTQSASQMLADFLSVPQATASHGSDGLKAAFKTLPTATD